jgi:hypothetical protein
MRAMVTRCTGPAKHVCEPERLETNREIAAMLGHSRTAVATMRRAFLSNDTQFLLGRFADR